MRPRRVLHEGLQEGRRRTGARPTSAQVLDVGVLGLDHFVVGLIEWHTPHLLPCRRSRSEQIVGEFVVVDEQPSVLFAQRHHDGARQRCQIDDEPRLKSLLDVRNQIAENESPLRVRVQHLDRLA